MGPSESEGGRACRDPAPASRDELTQLASRGQVDAVSRSTDGCRTRAVVLIDLDRFRAINDAHGHHVGDRVLCTVAQRLSDVAHEAALIARISADEFALVLAPSPGGESSAPDSADLEAQAYTLARSALAAIREPITIEERSLFLDAAIGVATGGGEVPLWDLVSRAGATVEDLKRAGSSQRVSSFDPDRHGALRETEGLAVDLRAAVSGQQLEIHYQPIVEMIGRRTVGVEALLRWSHPEHGRIPPLRFIPLAEESGLMGEIGQWVLEQGCLQARAWSERFARPPFVSINLSVRQLEDPGFVGHFRETLAATGVDPRQLKVEVTESVLASETSALVPILNDLRSTGVGVLLDDFGTGYSSLGYVRELPVDGVKLDRIFTRDLATSAGAWAIARAVVSMLGQLGFEMIAEGIETSAHLAQLRSLGCSIGQGYYFGRPAEVSQIAFEGLEGVSA